MEIWLQIRGVVSPIVRVLVSSPKMVLTLLALVPLLWLAAATAMSTPSQAQAESRIATPQGTHLYRPVGQSSSSEPLKGAPGSSFSVRGSGFRDFSPVESMTLGGLNILGNRTVSTDGDGNFQVDGLIVPGLDQGVYSLVVKVGTGDLETTSVSTFEVTEATEASSAGTPVAEALAPLTDTLERVFHFNNATKAWSFYDPRPEFANINTLKDIAAGQVYWIKVTRSVTVTLNGQTRQLTCSNEGTPQQDCWNLLVW